MVDLLEEISKIFMNKEVPFRRSNLVKGLLTGILNEEILVQASWHPYGFLQIRFESEQLWKIEKKTVRLHIWDVNYNVRQKPDWPIHNHSYTLYSEILIGEIENETYNVTRNPVIHTGHLYEASYQGRYSTLSLTDIKVYYELANKQVLRQNDRYEIPINQFHTAKASRSPLTATIVLTANSSFQSQYVVGEINSKNIYSFERLVCSKKILVELLIKLLKYI